MSDVDPVAPLRAALGDIVAWLRDQRVSGVLIGGVAASILGRPRVTRDVDVLAMLEEGRWAEFLNVGERFGLAPRRSDCLAFAQESRVLLLRHQSSGIDVDVVFGSLAFEQETVDRAEWVEAAGLRLPLPAPEDLIVMKALAGRPRDMADVEGLLDANPRLDRKRILDLLRPLAAALDMPDIADDLEAMLRRREARKK